MSSFLKNVSKTYTFEGDTISISFTRMTRKQMMDISPYLPKSSDEAQTQAQQMDLVDKGIDILKQNMISFTGLKDSEGEDLTFNDISDEALFMELTSEIMADLMSESTIDEKKENS